MKAVIVPPSTMEMRRLVCLVNMATMADAPVPSTIERQQWSMATRPRWGLACNIPFVPYGGDGFVTMVKVLLFCFVTGFVPYEGPLSTTIFLHFTTVFLHFLRYSIFLVDSYS